MAKKPGGKLKEWFSVPKDRKTCRPATYREMLRYADRLDYCLLAVGIIGSFAAGACIPINLIAFQGIVSTLISGQQKYDTGDFDKDEFVSGIQSNAWIYFGNGFFIFLANLLGNSALFALCERQVFRYRKRFLHSVLNQDMEWFDHNEIGSLTHKINANIEKIKDGASDKVGIAIHAVGCLVSGVLVAFFQSWKMTLIMLCIIPCMALSVLASAKALAASVRKEMHEYSAAGAIADEVLSGIRTVMAFNAQHFEQERYRVRLKQGRVIGIRKAALTAFFAACMQLVIFAFMGGVFYYGTMLVVYEGMISGKVFSVFWTILIGAMRFSMALPQINVLLGAKAAAGELFEVIDRKPTLDCTSKSGIVLQDVKGHIEFSNIHFRYPSRPEITVLNGISFEVKPGQTVALVGHSGCGKSTLVGLLMRYYTQEGGSVTLDGIPLEDVNVQWLRSVVGIVSQEPVLFQASIVDNLRLGRADVRLEDIEEACRVANAHDFISKLPQGYDTFIGEGGIKLSGGQKQRLAIARALVRQPRILLLDEATSALDTESERVVQAALDAAASGRTTITIAHRLSTVRNADRIIVFDKGTIVESGTHEELLAFDGAYKQLVAAQHVKGSTAETEVVEEDEKEAAHSRASSLLADKRFRRSLSSVRNADGADVYIEDLQDELHLAGGSVPSTCDMFRYIGHEMRFFGTGFVLAIIRGCCWPAYTVVYSRIFKAIATFQADGNVDVIQGEAVTNAVLFGVIAIIAGVTTFLSGFMLGKAGETVAYRLRTSVYENLLRQDATFFDASGHSVGALTSRLSQDAANVQAAIDQRFAEVLQGFTAVVVGIVVGFTVGWNEALFCLFVALLVIAIQTVISMYLRRRGIADAQSAGDAARIVTESIENVKTVQALTGQQHIFEKFGDAARAPHSRAYARGVVMSVSIATANSYIAFNFWACYLFGMWLVVNDWSQPYAIFQVVEAITIAGTLMSSSASYFPEFITALVSQEPTLFNLSIRDNIAYGLTEASDADVQAAARLANIDAFVSSLPEGYETSVGGRGTRLSGGQRQRIAIARAIIRKPKILLLDEATAALDGESERLVQEALDRASSGRTCVVVAHRLSTIQNADLICVIENGRCVEAGTHQQLLESAGLYYRLVKSQSMA